MPGEWLGMSLGDVIDLKRGYDLPSRDRREGPVSDRVVVRHHRLPC